MAIDFKKILKGITLKNDTDQSKQLTLQVNTAATTATTTTLEASQTVNRTIVLPDASTTLVGTNATQTLTSKSIDADTNTITNIDNNDIKAAAAIDATKIADGSVTSAEFQFINTLSSNAQTQIDAKASAASLTAHTGASSGVHGVTGAVVGTTDTQTLTAKTIVAASNTITTAVSGNLIATELNAALSELQTDIDTRATSAALTSHTGASTGVHGVTGAVVGTTDTQVLTNKDIDGGAAANTRRITLPKDTLTNLQALTRKQGTIVFDTNSSKPYYDDGVNLKVIGSGGTTNLINDGDAEAANIFTVYNDASTTRPVDGTGGTNANVDPYISSTLPLTGGFSFRLGKTGAVSTQGSGVSASFTVPLALQAKVLQIEFDYIVSGGTFAAGSSTADSDVIVYIYDVTNSALIEPTSIKLLSNSSTIADKYIANFQTSATGTSYRLIFHYASASALNYELKIDNVSIKPSNYVYGTPITDWTTWTPTSTWTSGATHTGLKRRVGGDVEYKVKLAITGAVTAANLIINLPSGDVIDTNRVLDTSANTNWNYGQVTMLRTASATYIGGISYNNTTSFQIRALNAASTYVQDVGAVTNTVPATWASPDVISIDFRAPIVGQSATTQMSDSYDGRQIGYRGNNSATALSGTPARIVWTNTDRDDVAGYSAGTYTVRSAGWYDVSASLYISGTPAVDQTSIIYIYRNGAVLKDFVHRYKVAAATTTSLSIGDSFYFNSGDTIEVYGSSDATTPSIASSTTKNTISISKRQAPTTISATEKITMRYTNVAGTAIGTSAAVFPYPTKVSDSHNAYNTGTGLFTCPVEGTYRINASYTTAGVALTTSQGIDLYVRKTGTDVDRRLVLGNGATVNYQASYSTEIDCLAGDTLGIFAVSAVATTAVAIANLNVLSISRIK